MYAILYKPGQPPQMVRVTGIGLPTVTTKFVSGAGEAAKLLGCSPGLVDVLASGPGYAAFSVFDHDGEPNLEVMRVLSELTSAPFDPAEEDELLSGPVLVVRQGNGFGRRN